MRAQKKPETASARPTSSALGTPASIWGNPGGVEVAAGRIVDLGLAPEPPSPEPTDPLPLEPQDELEQEPEPEVPRGIAEIDLTASVIEETSLLDDQADVLGEIIIKPGSEEEKPHE